MRAPASRRAASRSWSGTAARSPSLNQMSDDDALLFHELTDAEIREIEQRDERLAPEGHRFGRALYFDEAPVAGLDDVHVDFSAAVVFVRQVEQRLGVDDADARRGDVVGDRDVLDPVALFQLLERKGEGDEGAGDRRRARAAV